MARLKSPDFDAVPGGVMEVPAQAMSLCCGTPSPRVKAISGDGGAIGIAQFGEQVGGIDLDPMTRPPTNAPVAAA